MPAPHSHNLLRHGILETRALRRGAQAEETEMSMTYTKAMEVRTQEEADAAFEDLVKQCMYGRPCDRQTAEQIQRSNLGYYAGYYNEETRERIERLFKCAHPIFGPIANNGSPTPERALKLGMAMGKKARAKHHN
jgi:hypothetical protein